MLNVSSAYQNAIKSPSREIKTSLIFNGDTSKIVTDGIISASIVHYSNSEDTLHIGEFCTSSLKVTLHKDSNIAYNNASVQVNHGIKVNGAYESVKLGTFYITEVTKNENNDILSFVAYDSSERMNVVYIPSINYPATLGEVLQDIQNQCNVPINYMAPTSGELTIEGYVDGITCIDYIKYLASLQGKNARINADDQLEFYWYQDVDYTIELTDQWQDGFVRTTDEDIIINSLTCIVDNETTISSGEGYGITFENPYMTQEQLDTILTSINGFSYTPCTLTWRGNPSLEITDVVKVIDKKGGFHRIIFSEYTTSLTGMKSDVTVKGETEKEVAMNQSPTEIKISKLYNELVSGFKEATETILGNKGGYFTIDTDEDGFPCGWTIMNTPSLRDDTCLWRMTSGGFGYSSNGGKTFTDITIDMLGRINANSITTGILRGEVFDLNLIDGSITMGIRDSSGAINEPWFKVDKNGFYMKAIQTMQESLDEWKSETEDSLQTIAQNEVTATANNLKIEFNTLASNLQEQIDSTNDIINLYFDFSSDGLIIGKNDSPFKTQITNEKLSFLQNNTEVAFISNTKLYITTGVFSNQMIIGTETSGYYVQKLQSNGVLLCTYVKTLS